ncbi:glycosyltransferase family 9 protein [Termitidicoccus mucosus]|uniref:Glycosyl transferase n=1 Tax=Termitidicoccus mucosus TaxID=1184151 RepID=A0A178ID28_9BACT|nr:hypothetical protein AW736_19860 [Opitutaceae bacterium TSB47]
MSTFAQNLYSIFIARYIDWLGVRHRRPLMLFFRDGGIGDILCTLPAAVALAAREPGAYKIYCTNPAFVALPAMAGRFDRVLGIKCNDLVASIVASRHRVHRFHYPDELPGQASRTNLVDELAASVGLPAGTPWPRLHLGPPSRRVGAVLKTVGSSLSAHAGRSFVCIHTGPTWKAREWPRAHWARLVQLLRERFGCQVIQLGASQHFRDGPRAEPAVAGALDCRDKLNLADSLQLVSRSSMLIGVDSGMIHGAIALGVPAAGLFGPTSGEVRLPKSERIITLSAPDLPCLGCHHRHPRLHWQSGCPHDVRCMAAITPERVLAAAESLLRGQDGRSREPEESRNRSAGGFASFNS